MGEAYEPRPGRPINATVEVSGDRWSLLVLRDIVLGHRRRFREPHAGSEEGIASNILADRLKRLVEPESLTREGTRAGQRARGLSSPHPSGRASEPERRAAQPEITATSGPSSGKRSSTSGSWPATTRRGPPASCPILSKAPYMPVMLCRIGKGRSSSRFS